MSTISLSVPAMEKPEFFSSAFEQSQQCITVAVLSWTVIHEAYGIVR